MIVLFSHSSFTKIKDHISQSNREELIMPHWKNLQCKPFGKESPTRRGTVTELKLNIKDVIAFLHYKLIAIFRDIFELSSVVTKGK